MELPVVIFVSAITGAISSVVIQILFQKISKTNLAVPSPLEQKDNEQKTQLSGQTIRQNPKKEPNAHEEKDNQENPEENAEQEEQDEDEIPTLSDVSLAAPKLGRFKDLNIPSIDDDSIQVSDVHIPTNEEPVPETSKVSDVAKSIEPKQDIEPIGLEPNTVPEHVNIDDDDETVLVKRTPPK